MNRASLFSVVLALLLSASCAGPEEPERAEVESAAAEADQPAGPRIVRLSAESARLAGIRVSVAERTAVADSIEVAGRATLDEDRTAHVGSFVEGVVTTCCKSVGSYVRKGEILAKVHSHRTHEIVAEYLTTMAELRSAQSELEYARQARERAAKLLELKAGSLQAVQRAETDVRAAEADVAAATAAVEQSKAHLDFYGLDPQAVGNPKGSEEPHIEILAPISGTIVERSVKLGDVVTTAVEMYVLSDLSSLWVIAQVPEERLGVLQNGMRVDVRTRAFPERAFPGRVTQIASELDPETMTVQVRCSVPNPGGELKTGMYVTVRLRPERTRSALVVPEDAIQRIEEAPAVFVESGKDAFEARRVRVGQRIDGKIEILEGLKEGERLAVSGVFALKSELLKAELTGDE